MSIAENLGDAAVTALQGLDLTGVADASIVRRKAPTLPIGTDPPAIVVTIGEEQQEHLTGATKLVTYPLLVTVFTGGGRKLQDDDTLRDWRESIREELDDRGRTTFTAVTGFNKSDFAGGVLYPPAALPKDVNAMALLFEIEVLEPRAT